MQKKENKVGGSKVATFFKRNIYYVLMIVCVIAIGTMITVAAVVNKKGGDIDVVAPPVEDNKPVVKEEEFIIKNPVADSTVLKSFSDTILSLDGTEMVFRTHTATDFSGTAASNVLAPFSGVVETITVDGYNGTTVVINHQNGYKSTLKLLDKVTLKKGQALKTGDVIGKISTSSSYEVKDGVHVHYELTKDNKLCDVMQFIPGDNK